MSPISDWGVLWRRRLPVRASVSELRSVWGFAAGGNRFQHLRAALPPWVELVRRVPRAPRLERTVRRAAEPPCAAELVVRFNEVRAECQRLLEERLCVLIHLALEIDEPEIEVRVERGFLVVVETNRLRQMLDGFPEDA